MELLPFYLNSSLVQFKGNLHVQKIAACIGSRLAPRLSDLLLAQYDGKLKEELSATEVTKVFRHVDNCFVLYEFADCLTSVQDVDHIFGIFQSTLPGLVLRRELPIDSELLGFSSAPSRASRLLAVFPPFSEEPTAIFMDSLKSG